MEKQEFDLENLFKNKQKVDLLGNPIQQFEECDNEQSKQLQMTMTLKKETQRTQIRKLSQRELFHRKRFGQNTNFNHFNKFQDIVAQEKQGKHDKILDNIHKRISEKKYDFEGIQNLMLQYQEFISDEDCNLISNYKNCKVLTERISDIVDQSCQLGLSNIKEEKHLELLQISLYIIHNIVYDIEYVPLMIPQIGNLVVIIKDCHSTYSKALALNVLVNMISQEGLYLEEPISFHLQELNIISIIEKNVLPEILKKEKPSDENETQVTKFFIEATLRFIYNFLEFGVQEKGVREISVLVKVIARILRMKNQELIDNYAIEELLACMLTCLQQLSIREIIDIYEKIEGFLIRIQFYVVCDQNFENIQDFNRKKNILKDITHLFSIIVGANISFANQLMEGGLLDIIKVLFEIKDQDHTIIKYTLQMLSRCLYVGDVECANRIFNAQDLGDQYYVIKKLFEYLNSENQQIQFESLRCCVECIKKEDLKQLQIFVASGLMSVIQKFLYPERAAHEVLEALICLDNLFYMEFIHKDNKDNIPDFEDCECVKKFQEEQGPDKLNKLLTEGYGEEIIEMINKLLDKYLK